jgi:predicted adenylyl cyclase CyaB
MPKNIEIKAKIVSLDKILSIVEEISDSIPELLVQEDTFFNSPKGRLKIRIFEDTTGELIYYKRLNVCGPKRSRYQIFQLADPNPAKRWFSEMFGIKGVVRKRRTLYKIGNTRIHLDRVDSLGDFIELEVVFGDNDTIETGKDIVDNLMRKLNIYSKNLISGAYIDLIASQQSKDNIQCSELEIESSNKSLQNYNNRSYKIQLSSKIHHTQSSFQL